MPAILYVIIRANFIGKYFSSFLLKIQYHLLIYVIVLFYILTLYNFIDKNFSKFLRLDILSLDILT